MNSFAKALIAAAVVIGIAIVFVFRAPSPTQPGPSDPTTPEVAIQDEETSEPVKRFDAPTIEPVDVFGTVKDDLGAVVAEASVKCEKITGSPSAPKFELFEVGTPDESGSFSFQGLLPAKYKFTASAAGYAPKNITITISEGVTPGSIDLVLSAGLVIRGTVRDPLGAPVAGALLAAFKERAKENASLEERLQALIQFEEMKSEEGVFATTDETGEYAIQGLDAMKYRVQVTASGYANMQRRYVPAGSDGVDFDLIVGGQLAGIVTDSGGQPIEGADVEIYVSTGTQDLIEIIQERALPPLDQRQTDKSGRFLFDTLGGEASYRLVARASGYQKQQIEKVLVDVGQLAELEIVLEGGSVLRGIVYDPNGNTVAGARCKVNPVGVQAAGPPTDFNDEPLETGDDGEFVFDTLGEGSYRLVVSHDDFATFVENKLRPSGETISVQLSQGCAITGGVFERATGEAIVGAQVTVHDIGGEQKTGITDAFGNYFVKGISETRRGVAHLNVEKLGYERVSNHKVEVAEGTVTEGIDHFLDRNGIVRGRVVDARGNPVIGVNVAARRNHSSNAVVVNVGNRAFSEPDGSFVIEQVQTGEGTFLEGTHSDFLKSQSEQFIVAAGEEVTGLELVMRLGGALSGRVVDENGRPIAEATVGAKDDLMSVVNPASLTNKVYTDASGNFTLQRLEAGEQVLLCAAKGYLTVEVTGHDVQEGRETQNVEIVMATGAFLAGTVRNSLGDPIAGARVTVIDTSAGLKKLTTSTDTSGAYRFDELGYFPVEVEAEATGFSKVRLFDQPVNSDRIDFVLEAFGSISGVVYTESGEALRAFSVTPKHVDPNDQRAKSRVPSRTFTTRDGVYSFDGLQPGTYEVMIGAPGYAAELLDNVVVSSNRNTELPAVALGAGGKISGVVYDAVDGGSIPGATVTVVGGIRHFLQDPTTGASSQRGRPDQVSVLEDGSFQIIGLASGKVTLRVEHRNYMTEMITDVHSGTSNLEIALVAGGSIEGTVSSADHGKEMSGLQILLSGEQRGQDRRVVTDRRGRFSITGLDSGMYTLRVTNFGRPGQEVDLPSAPTYKVEVVAGETTIFDISY